MRWEKSGGGGGGGGIGSGSGSPHGLLPPPTTVSSSSSSAAERRREVEGEEEEVAAVLAGFQLIRVLDQDAKTRSAVLLGTFEEEEEEEGEGEEEEGEGEEEATKGETAIVLLEKTHFESSFFSCLGEILLSPPAASPRDSGSQTQQLRHLSKVTRLGQNDVYHWLMAWRAEEEEATGEERGTAAVPADMKISVIRPATAAHISKYERQEKIIVRETPEMYQSLVRPWVEGQPPARIKWVYNILEGKKELENVLYRDDDPLTGFVILPDLKWDRRTLSSLYLICIVQDRSLRSLRCLRPTHLPLLRKMVEKASLVASLNFGMGSNQDEAKTKLRCFLHYQPSYYHLHLHILSADYTSHQGAIVAQAHLLDDVIDLLEMGVDFEKRTFTYALGERHELMPLFRARQDDSNDTP